MPIAPPISLGTGQGVASASSVALTTIAAIPAGSLVVVGVTATFIAAQTVTGVSDGTNTYTRAAGATWDGTAQVVTDLWYKENAAAVSSSATLTATFSAASNGGTNVPIICAAYTQNVITGSLDKTNSGKQEPGTNYAAGTTGTLSQASEIAFGFLGAVQNVTSVTEDANYTNINRKIQGGGNNWCGNLAYRIVSSTSAINYQPTATSSFGAAVIATFKGAQILASVGSFAETGSASTFRVNEAATGGSFAETGNAATFLPKLGTATGAFLEAGGAATFSTRFAPSAGSYVVSGFASGAITLLAFGGSYVVAGNPANVTILEAEGLGAYIVTGNAANLVRDFVNWLPSAKPSAAWSSEAAPASAWTPIAPPSSPWITDSAQFFPAPVTE